ncbi:transposase [Bacillus cereus]
MQKKAINHEFHQHIGMSRGGKTTKIHTIVDSLGNPILFHLTGGNIFDSTPVCKLLDKISIKKAVTFLVTRLMALGQFVEYITNREATYTIPPKSNAKTPWKVDWYLYKERHVVECFFNKIKHFRRVATRYDKLATSFFSICLCRCYFSIDAMNNSF